MIRRSLELTETQWQQLEQLAAVTGSAAQKGPQKGQPSWRTFIRRIAEGEFEMNTLKTSVSNNNIVTCPHCEVEYYENDVGKDGQKSSEIGLYHYCVDGCQQEFDVIWHFDEE